MSSTFVAVIETISISHDFKLSFTIVVVDTEDGLSRHFPFGNGATVANGRLVGVRRRMGFGFLHIFVIFVGSVLSEDAIFFVVISLPNRRIVDFVFSGYVAT